MAITLDIIREDLSFLYTAKMNWGQDWLDHEHGNRFEDVKGQPIKWELPTAYWLPDWTTAMIFRAYLTSINAEFQILLDNADGLDPYVVLTTEEF
jgi:hypothetical protein